MTARCSLVSCSWFGQTVARRAIGQSRRVEELSPPNKGRDDAQGGEFPQPLKALTMFGEE